MRSFGLIFLTLIAASAPVSAHSLYPRQQGNATACAQVSAASSAYLAATPSATVAVVDGSLVNACLKSVPLNKPAALDLLHSLVPHVKLHSTLGYLANPPSGYLYPSIDLRTQFGNIAAAVAAGKYSGEYEFQTDLYALILAARDGHFNFSPDLLGVAEFTVANVPLVSFSTDGLELPDVYVATDVWTIKSDELELISRSSTTNGSASNSTSSGSSSGATPEDTDNTGSSGNSTDATGSSGNGDSDGDDASNGTNGSNGTSGSSSTGGSDGTDTDTNTSGGSDETDASSGTDSDDSTLPDSTETTDDTDGPTDGTEDDDGATIKRHKRRDATFTPSPITQINGIAIFDYLMGRSNQFSMQDPDAAYNNIFAQTAQIAMAGSDGLGGFRNPVFFPGSATRLTFANGSTISIPTTAELYASFDGVTDGQSAYNKFCVRSTPVSTAGPLKRELLPAVPFYPWPVIKTYDDNIAGYFLNDTDLSDVAVLSILSFDAETTASDFQSMITQFLSACQSANKKKLVIDVFGNTGGVVDLALDAFAQLFPNLYPASTANMRASDVLFYLGLGYSQSGNTATGEPIDIRSDLRANLTAFDNWPDLFGPNALALDNVTEVFQQNLTTPTAIPIDLNGTASPVFDPANIVLLTDGLCGSTCALFAELLKVQAGVKSIAVGGRPQVGPMQAVGATKGKQVFSYDYTLDAKNKSDEALTRDQLESANATSFNLLNDIPQLRTMHPDENSVNGLNHIRVNDTSVTPLQFVYEAADCRFFFTKDMLVSQVPIWSRAAKISFNGASNLCIRTSTGHASSISGGALNATDLGIVTQPPKNAKTGIVVGLAAQTEGFVGSTSKTAWGGKAWGAGGWNLASGNSTNNSTSGNSGGNGADDFVPDDDINNSGGNVTVKPVPGSNTTWVPSRPTFAVNNSAETTAVLWTTVWLGLAFVFFATL